MRREQLEQMLGKKVTVTLFNNAVYTGILRKTRDEDFKDNPNLFIPWKYYFLTNETNQCVSCLFRTSHVRSCKVIE